jgi:hypothetical protein
VKVKTSTELNPGVYCDGITVNSGATLTLNPRIYYFDRGTFSVNGDGTVIGTGVALIFTSSTGTNWATATINGNASVNLTAPNSGSTEGIVTVHGSECADWHVAEPQRRQHADL